MVLRRNFLPLMTLKPPFELNENEGNKYDNIINAIKSQKITDSNGNYKEEIKKNYSDELWELIDKMMNVDPKQRPTIENILEENIIIKRMYSLLEENKFNSQEADAFIKKYEEKKEKENKQSIVDEKKNNENKFKVEIYESTNEDEVKIDEKNLTQETISVKKEQLDYNFLRQLSLIDKKINRKSTLQINSKKKIQNLNFIIMNLYNLSILKIYKNLN